MLLYLPSSKIILTQPGVSKCLAVHNGALFAVRPNLSVVQITSLLSIPDLLKKMLEPKNRDEFGDTDSEFSRDLENPVTKILK